MTQMTHDPDPLTIGDPIPNVVLPDVDGNGVGLNQQHRAGRWQVLVFLEPEEIAARRDSIEAARARMEAIEGQVFVVAVGETNGAVPGADLYDASRKAVAYYCGGANAGIAVVSPGSQLVACLTDLELDDAIRLCERRYAADAPSLITHAAPVLVIENILTPELCEALIAFWKMNPKQTGGVASAQQGNAAEIESIKRRDDVILPDGQLFSDVKASMGRRVLPLIERAFRLKVASMEAPRIGGYDEANLGAFGRHRDNTTPHTAHRRFALTLNLNTGAYEGGELRFPEYGRGLYAPPAGGGVVFSCSLLHEALPVTKGLRLGMFTFFTDAEGAKQERKRAT